MRKLSGIFAAGTFESQCFKWTFNLKGTGLNKPSFVKWFEEITKIKKQ